MVIDAHHHFWNYSREEHGWIDDSMAVLRRSFGPADLKREIDAAGVDGVVSVQARQSLAETDWLLEFAARNPFMRGVVGWVPLCDPSVDALLDSYAAAPRLRGVRHVLQDEPDDRFMLRSDFRRGLGAVQRHNLVYDILIFSRHLPHAAPLVDEFPGITFVLDHVAKPPLRSGDLTAWARHLTELAKRPNVACKFSGLVTEADHASWTDVQIERVFDITLEAFGPKRLLFGSDWPVCLVASGYRRWVSLVRKVVARLTPAEQADVLGGNAVRIYRLPAP